MDRNRKHSFIKDGLVYTSANVLNLSIPFFLLPILTRLLTPAEYGLIAMFQAAMAIASVFTGIGLNGAVRVKYFKGDKGTFPRYVGVAHILLAFFTALTAITVALLADHLEQLTGLVTSLLLLSVFSSATQFIVKIKLTILQVKLKPLNYGIIQILQTLFNASLSLYLVTLLSLGAEGRIYGIVFSNVVFGILALALMLSQGEVRLRWNSSDASSAARFGIPLIPHLLGGVAVTMADRFILSNKIGQDAVGIYFVALQLSMPIVLLAESLNRAFMPWVYRAMAGRRKHQVVSASYFMMILFVGMSILYAIIIWLGFEIIVGKKYLNALPLTFVLIIASCFGALYYTVVHGIFFSEKTARLSVMSGTLGILYVAAAFIVVDTYGMTGLAITYLLYQVATFFGVWILASRLFPMPWTDYRNIETETKRLCKRILPI